MRVLTEISTRTYRNKYAHLLKRVRRTDIDFERVAEEPFRAILLHSPGRKPWVIIVNPFIEPQRGGTTERINFNACVGSAAPTELIPLLSACTQGFISGFALIPPWALKSVALAGLIYTLSPAINHFKPLHNTALAALLSTFRLGHLRE